MNDVYERSHEPTGRHCRVTRELASAGVVICMIEKVRAKKDTVYVNA